MWKPKDLSLVPSVQVLRALLSAFTNWWQEVVWRQQKGGSVGLLGSVPVVRRSLAVFIISEQLARLLEPVCCKKQFLTSYSHLSNKRDVMLTDFGKFHPAQNKNPPCMFIDFITDLSIFLQNLMMIFLTVILSYKSLF